SVKLTGHLESLAIRFHQFFLELGYRASMIAAFNFRSLPIRGIKIRINLSATPRRIGDVGDVSGDRYGLRHELAAESFIEQSQNTSRTTTRRLRRWSTSAHHELVILQHHTMACLANFVRVATANNSIK